jgi:hypothetical protein
MEKAITTLFKKFFQAIFGNTLNKFIKQNSDILNPTIKVLLMAVLIGILIYFIFFKKIK